ncbi:tetratricopeptide repeat protein [Candidatus Kaiserbacteria bacterium]|nr:tetratricopeptide repeat protein [Candidatus Kaiserbacteria bacterium]
MRTFSETATRWSLTLLATLLPLFVIPGAATTTPQSKMLLSSVLVAIAAVFWTISFFYRGTLLPRNMLVLASVLLPITYALSSLIAGWPSSSILSGLGEQDTLAAMCIWFASLVIAASVFSETRSRVFFLRAALLGGFVMALFQAARLFFPEALSFGPLTSQISTVAGSWHDLGIVLGLFAIIGAVFYRSESSALWRYAALLVASLSFLFLIVINMSDIWYVLAGVLALITAYMWFTATISYTEKFMLPGLCIAALLLGYFGTFVHENLPSKMQVVAVEVRPSWSGTFSIGKQALEESRTLFFGSGPNTFVRNWALHKPASVNATQFWGFDFSAGVGVVPTAFVTLGLFGLIAWLLISLTFFFSLWRRFRQLEPLSSESTMQFAIAGAVLYLLVFHITYAPGIAISALLFLFLGLFAAARSGVGQLKEAPLVSETGERAQGIYEKVVVCIFAVIAVSACGISLQALASDIQLNQSIQAYAKTGDIAASRKKIERSLSIWPSNDRAHRAAVELGILQLQALAASQDAAEQQRLESTLSETIGHGLAAVEIDKNDYQNWLTLAILYQQLAGAGISGAYEQAKNAFAKAQEENPTNPLLAFRLAQLEAVEGNREVALKNLNDAVTMKPDFAAAYFLASQLFAQGSQLQEAIQSAATAAQLVPDDPLAWYNLGTMLYAAGRYPESASAFAQAVSLNNDYSNALFMQALALNQSGDGEHALSLLMRVAELNPSDGTIPVIIQNLKDGKEPLSGLSGA